MIEEPLDAECGSSETKDDCKQPLGLYKETTKGKKKLSILRKINHLLPQALLSKTAVCQHDQGCFENVVRKALTNFLLGFAI